MSTFRAAFLLALASAHGAVAFPQEAPKPPAGPS